MEESLAMNSTQWRQVLLTTIAALTVSISGVATMSYRLLYNPSESAPRGWYAVVPASRIQRDDFVVLFLSGAAAQLAADRQYLSRTVPLLKHVAALGGQHVCERAGSITINGSFAARAQHTDGAGRPLDAWSGCRTLHADELFLLSRNNDASFDSRYFGPVPRSTVLGRAIPLWTW